jgi:2,5-dioxopentanoate dehydrogenase
MELTGANVIGNKEVKTANNPLKAISPASGKELSGEFSPAGSAEVMAAVLQANAAFEVYRNKTGSQKAAFLRAIADEILSLEDVLIERAMAESGLPEARLRGERGRTMGQLKMFADLLEEGSWVRPALELADPNRTPFPKPDIRNLLIPVGPVVVFTASNFPLAFSTAGGDTASALAAGNPVIVKAHESHLGTNELVAKAISRAAKKTGMPSGVFSSLNGSGHELGQLLVTHPDVKSVAFTGSQKGGLALYDLAQKRDEPIPIFAEMGSVNPVVLFANSLRANGPNISKTLANSLTMGCGQFCTNPGLLLVQEYEGLDEWLNGFAQEVAGIGVHGMLNRGIYESFKATKKKMLELPEVELVAESNPAQGEALIPRSGVAKIDAAEFIQNPDLQDEVFGPYCLVVVCKDSNEITQACKSLHGQLTGTVYGELEDLNANPEAIAALQMQVGRLTFGGAPTGVEVNSAMQHGGPFPATTDARFTSVGSQAIYRFVRPLAYQNWPNEALPEELQDGNPLGLWRAVNGVPGKH